MSDVAVRSIIPYRILHQLAYNHRKKYDIQSNECFADAQALVLFTIGKRPSALAYGHIIDAGREATTKS
jgi:hypothetical protein